VVGRLLAADVTKVVIVDAAVARKALGLTRSESRESVPRRWLETQP